MSIRARLKWFAFAAAGTALFAAAGCRGIPTAHEKDARRELASAREAYLGAERPPLPDLEADSPLPDLIEYALLNSPSLEASYYDWAASVEKITVDRSYPYPMLQFSAQISNMLTALTPALMTAPMAPWPLPVKPQLRGEAAYRDAEAKRAAFESGILMTAYSVKKVYYQMWTLNEELRLARETLGLTRDIERFALDRLEVGRATQQDVLRAQMEEDRLTNMLASLDDSRKPLDARMRTLLGLPPDADMPRFEARIDAEEATFTEDDLLAQAYERSPELKGLQQQVMKALALYTLAEKDKLPDVSFGLGANVEANPVAYSPQFGLMLPIWRDKIAAEIAGAEASRGAAEARLTAAQLDLAMRFAEAAFQWRDADRDARLYHDSLIPKARASYQSAEAGYTGAVTSFLDLIDAEKALLDYQVMYVKALAKRQTMLAEISLALLANRPAGTAARLGEAPSSIGLENDGRTQRD